MTANFKRSKFSRFLRSRKALAVPITYLILFVSSLLLVSVTYVFAIDQLDSQKQPLQTLTAKQDMMSLVDDGLSVSAQPGSASTLDFRDSGGQLVVAPTANNLTLSVSDNLSINATIFDQTVGSVSYNLASAAAANFGFYMRGDSNPIGNSSGVTPSQLSFELIDNQPEIQLQYRPIVSYVTAGLDNGQSVNFIRIYVINLNSSDPLASQGELPLRISCTGTQLLTETYSVTYAPGYLTITSLLGGLNGSVSVPISSTAQGAIIHFEVVESNVSIERCVT